MEIANGYSLTLTSSSLQANVGYTVANAQANSVAGDIVLNKWQRIVVTFSNTDNYPKIYINANLAAGTTVNKSGNRLSPAGQTVYIGNRAALDRQFDGLINRHCFYIKAWSDDEVLADYISNVQPSDSKVLDFLMNEASGNLIDSVAALEATPSNVTQGVVNNYNSRLRMIGG